MPYTNADIMRQLGKLEADMTHATESRGHLHRQLEGHTKVLNDFGSTLQQVDFTLKATAGIAAQTRDKLATFEAEFKEQSLPIIHDAVKFKEEAEPLLKILRGVRTGIWFVVALLGVCGLTVGVAFANAEQLVRIAIRAWLGL